MFVLYKPLSWSFSHKGTFGHISRQALVRSAGPIFMIPSCTDLGWVQVVHSHAWFLPTVGRTCIGVRTHHELLFRDLHGLRKLLGPSYPTLPRMGRRSPRWLRLWRLIFDKLLGRHSCIHDLVVSHGHLLIQNAHADLILFIWSLVRHLVVIRLLVGWWLESECGFASNFSSPVGNLRALELVLLWRVSYFLTDQIIHILLLLEAPKL